MLPVQWSESWTSVCILQGDLAILLNGHLEDNSTMSNTPSLRLTCTCTCQPCQGYKHNASLYCPQLICVLGLFFSTVELPEIFCCIQVKKRQETQSPGLLNQQINI